MLVQASLLECLSLARWDRRLFWKRALRVLRRVLLGQRLPQQGLRLLSLFLLLQASLGLVALLFLEVRLLGPLWEHQTVGGWLLGKLER